MDAVRGGVGVDAGGGVNACGGDDAAAAADDVSSRDADGGLDSRLIGAAVWRAGVAIGHGLLVCVKSRAMEMEFGRSYLTCCIYLLVN